MSSSTYKWQFTPRFRRHAFGWRSDTPMLRIAEAVSEIKKVARIDPALAAEGAVLLLEKLGPALEQVDSSSGALGSAVNKAIKTLVPIIAKADIAMNVRGLLLERLWAAFQEDEMPYIEMLGDYWGELCVSPELASHWADEFLPLLKHTWSAKSSGYAFFKGTTACLASLHTAGRNEELLALLKTASFPWWMDRRWGVKALVAMGKKSEALRYAEESRGLNDPGWQIAEACEAILLSSGMEDEAYGRYAQEANQGTTNLATFRAIVKKYPSKTPETILRDLVASTPGAEGKWFAAAKDAGFFDVAIEVATRSPTDPRTLIRAAQAFVEKQPRFAFNAALIALRWISLGHGYEIQSADIFDAYNVLMQAAPAAGISVDQADAQVRELMTEQQGRKNLVGLVLSHRFQERDWR